MNSRTPAYTVNYTRAAARDLRKMDRQVARRLVQAAAGLAVEPRPSGCKKLTGRDAYRIRVGDYRVTYEIADDVLTITVVRAAHRREAY